MELLCEISNSEDPCVKLDNLYKTCISTYTTVDKKANRYKIMGIIENVIPIIFTLISLIITLVLNCNDEKNYITSTILTLNIGFLLFKPIFNFNEKSIILKRINNNIKHLSRDLQELKFKNLDKEKLSKKMNRINQRFDDINYELFSNNVFITINL
ncbi:MAG: hypothetical protein QW478_00815 [Candidatus Micrarchaeaceae archaeon]